MILYGSNDMAKLGCNECAGCSECCRGMGQSVILDPYDIYQIQAAAGQTFAQLLQDKAELHVEDGLILPSLKMQDDTDACGFLDRNGRCGIHAYRPGLCRLFPLGRKYGENGLHYFLIEDGCQVQNRTKIKIKKWLDVKNLSAYEAFLTVWHDLRKNIQEQIATGQSDAYTKEVNVRMLQIFYQKPYDIECDFYEQFERRREEFNGAGQ
mgnify:CR=1 FL=1